LATSVPALYKLSSFVHFQNTCSRTHILWTSGGYFEEKVRRKSVTPTKILPTVTTTFSITCRYTFGVDQRVGVMGIPVLCQLINNIWVGFSLSFFIQAVCAARHPISWLAFPQNGHRQSQALLNIPLRYLLSFHFLLRHLKLDCNATLITILFTASIHHVAVRVVYSRSGRGRVCQTTMERTAYFRKLRCIFSFTVYVLLIQCSRSF
jgi:hypothetical protein